MSVIRTAQQKVDAHLENLTLVQSIAESIRNPQAITDSIKELIDGNSISEAKKQEALDAENSIIESRKLREQLEIDRSNHESTKASEEANLQKQKDDFEKEKHLHREKTAKEIDDFNQQKKQVEEEFLAREGKLKEREKLFAQAMAAK